ncbi:hypothetical protein EUTSA_v10022077mg, partial [Eutrema salsugineum]
NRMFKAEESCVVSDSTITSKFGDRPPSTYSMKIQSISQLQTLLSGNDGYKSRTFSSGKYNWRLVIYPKGNEKDNGTGFISMYVEFDSTSVATSTVLAYITFFIYNKKENKYYTIKDVEGKQFNALRPVWGFLQVLPLDTFNDPKNGYVFDGDQCEFGVDVMVPLTNWEVVSFSQKPSNTKVLKLFPKGHSTTYCKSLSIYLYLADGETIKAGEIIYIRGELQILDPFGSRHLAGKINYNCYNPSQGFAWIITPKAQVEKAYLDKEGSLKVEIEFEVVSTTKYSA